MAEEACCRVASLDEGRWHFVARQPTHVGRFGRLCVNKVPKRVYREVCPPSLDLAFGLWVRGCVVPSPLVFGTLPNFGVIGAVCDLVQFSTTKRTVDL